MTEEEVPECPVCAKHSVTDAIAAQGLLVTGMQAIIDRDKAQIQAVYDSLTQWDAHCAITMMLSFVAEICNMTGQGLRESLTDMRRQLDQAQADQ